MSDQINELVEAAKAWIAKMDLIEPIVNGHLALEHVHGRPYTGPNYGEEKKRMLAALASLDAPPKGQMPNAKALAESIIKRVVENAIRCQWTRNIKPLESDPDAEFPTEDELVIDALALALGEDTGCLSEEDDDFRERVDVLWLEDLLSMADSKAGGWIECSKELPPIHQQVLTWEKALMPENNFEDQVQMASRYSGGGWAQRSDAQYYEITHWQPLPTPPEAGIRGDEGE